MSAVEIIKTDQNEMVHGSPDILFFSAGEYVSELFSLPETGQFFDMEIDENEGTVVGMEDVDLPQIAALVLASTLAKTYIAGRWDQLSDMYDTNEERTIRARYLGATLNLAGFITNIEEDDDLKASIKYYRDTFNDNRGLLDVKIIGLKFSGSVASEALYESLEHGSLEIGLYGKRQQLTDEPRLMYKCDTPTVLEGHSDTMETSDGLDPEAAYKELCKLQGGEPMLSRERKQEILDFMSRLVSGHSAGAMK